MRILPGYLSCLSFLLVLGCAQSLLADSVNNVVTDFSVSSNPNGLWTYDYNGVAFNHSQAVSNLLGTGLPGWWTAEAIPNLLFIAQNITDRTVTYLTIQDPTNTMWLDSESGNVAVGELARACAPLSIILRILLSSTVANPR